MKDNFFKRVLYRLRGEYTTEQLIRRGMKVGNHFLRMNGVILDPDHCWHIEIGDNVTLAPRVHILCHDASTKLFLDYTKIGNVKIGNQVFIGAESVVLPGVCIGSRVIIGANSTVTHNIPDNVVAAGSPAKIICTVDDYLKKEEKHMKTAPCFNEEYTLRGEISFQKRAEMVEKIKDTIGYVK